MPVKPFISDSEEFIIQISAGANHSVLLTNRGNVYSTGSSHFGQLGHSDFQMKTVFTKVESLPPKVVFVSAGGNHSWAICDEASFDQMVKSPIEPVMDAYIDDQSFASETMLLKSVSIDKEPD